MRILTKPRDARERSLFRIEPEIFLQDQTPAGTNGTFHAETIVGESLARCLEVLAIGEPLVVFPEGTRQRGLEVQELRDMMFETARRIEDRERRGNWVKLAEPE